MNRVLFDGSAMQSTSTAKFHGGSEYAKFIFRTIIDSGYKFDIILDKNRHLTDDIGDILNDKFNGKIHYITSNKEMYNLADINRYDVFYTAHPYEYGDYTGSSQFWGVIHGLRGIELPWDKYKYQYYTSRAKRAVARIAGSFPRFVNYWKNKQYLKMNKVLQIPNAHFVTASFHSKYSLMNFFPFLKEDNIEVLYSPFDPLVKEDRKQPGDKYFLMISGNRYEKNVWRAVQAFDRLFSQGQLAGMSVKITGCNGLPFWSKIKNKNRFELLDYVSYEELGHLYNNAFAFVYPSLNEGFGYPPLYAMSVGVPVIASSSTSIPEVCADAACYFNPQSIDDLCSRLLFLYDNNDLRSSLIDNGKKRVHSLLEKQSSSINQFVHTLFDL